MIGVATSGALVAGGASAPSAPEDVRIRVLRSFIWAREPVPVGAEITMSRRFARELVGYGKAEILPDAPAPAPEAQPEGGTEPAEAPPADLLAEPEPAAARRQKKDPPA
jgi:hypothetical protein